MGERGVEAGPTPDGPTPTPTPTTTPTATGELDADAESVARRIALGKLAVQARTRTELERAMQAKNVPEEAAEAVLDRFTDVGLVDDARFARDWVESRQRRRHLSRSVLRQELRTKGVDRDDIDEALAKVEPADEIAAARELAERKLRSMTGLERAVRYRRLAGALSRRGFSSSVVATVVEDVLRSS